MKPSIAFELHRDAIRAIVLSHRAVNARIFGSVARQKDTDESDLDVLVDVLPDTSLFDIGAIRRELLDLLRVPVDVITPYSLPDSVRDEVLSEAIPV